MCESVPALFVGPYVRFLIVLTSFVMLLQMATSLLSQIHDGEQKWTICVYVSRMWHFRGGTDEGPIQHTDLVLLDSEVCAPSLIFCLP